MTITIAPLSAISILAIYLILMAFSHFGIVSWRYYHLLLGVLALLAGILLLIWH